MSKIRIEQPLICDCGNTEMHVVSTEGKKYDSVIRLYCNDDECSIQMAVSVFMSADNQYSLKIE